jgi:hypothetical protein
MNTLAWSALLGAALSLCLPVACAVAGAGSAGGSTEDHDAAESGLPGFAFLAWLAGCWESVLGETIIEEQWMRPRGGFMPGMSRTVVGGAAREHEFLDIRVDGASLVYTARPSGQAETSFRSVEITPERLVFENLEHDFPQRIIYTRAGLDSLVARIEGQAGGTVRGRDFPMRRAPESRLTR